LWLDIQDDPWRWPEGSSALRPSRPISASPTSGEPDQGGGSIAGQVQIAPNLVDQVKPTDVLFVIVRRPTGPPRPIAAKRIDAPKFPVQFEITSADVMVQGTELKGMVDVIARLDRDGQAGQAQPGDMEGRYPKNPTLPGGKDVNITIDKGVLTLATYTRLTVQCAMGKRSYCPLQSDR
jgi:cytochrome c-type biogenesis protein CcmH